MHRVAPPARVEGLSPPVRGNRMAERQRDGKPRSIPACAGEPRGIAVSLGRHMVYPRLCGGTPLLWRCCRVIRGLSPPVRGNPERR